MRQKALAGSWGFSLFLQTCSSCSSWHLLLTLSQHINWRPSFTTCIHLLKGSSFISAFLWRRRCLWQQVSIDQKPMSLLLKFRGSLSLRDVWEDERCHSGLVRPTHWWELLHPALPNSSHSFPMVMNTDPLFPKGRSNTCMGATNEDIRVNL